MAQQQLCQSCNQRHECHQVYEQLGRAKGPSVACNVLVAFALPIVVFIGALIAFEEILTERVNTAQMRTALSSLLALVVTLSVILVTRAVKTQLNKRRQHRN